MSDHTSPLQPRDGLFHQPAVGESSWLETNWFSFLVPEENLRGHVYVGFRTNLGVVFSSIMLWSRDCTSHLDFDYYDARIHLPMPAHNLDGYRLDNGLEVEMVEPLHAYRLSYEGFNGIRIDLALEALMPAVDSRETRLPEGLDFSHFHSVKAMLSDQVGHIDQTLMVEGAVVLDGKRIEVAHPSNRDHSWSPRPEYGHGCGYFDEGYFGKDFAFHVQTVNEGPSEGRVTNGYILDHGEVVPLRAGVGRYKVDGWVTRHLEYELEDDRGRTHRFVGEPTAITPLPTFPNQYNIAAVTRWTCDGEVGWGEYKWHWEVSEMLGRDGW